MAYQDVAQFSVGDALTRMGHVLGQSVRPAAIYILILSVLSIIAELLTGDGEMSILAAAMQLVAGIVGIIAGYQLILAMLRETGMLSVEGPSRYLSYFGLSVLYTLGVGLGLILLIVPGVFLFCRWMIAAIVLVGEQEGAMNALKISWDATRGHALKIFLATLVLILIVGAIVGLGATGLMVNETLGLIAIQIAVNIAGVIFMAFMVGIYGLLRSPAGQLQDVFG